ncbi:hypothetical protein ZIOFF_056889 [Zingiber officinale]|uniref:UBC core domain-containing protein n=1 Tax=Zingiber officinale TaxID=94328 RepID=A0A8J5FIP2_ZINOF|nr:hypothetical protein ZIOFF_056889 [Zingiber officinale]
MAERACVKRLLKEYRAICKEPPPQIAARPSPSDMLDWYFVIEGSDGTPYAGCLFHLQVDGSVQEEQPLDCPTRPGLSKMPSRHRERRGTPPPVPKALRGAFGDASQDRRNIAMLGGYYYGKLKFPPDYPFKPPSIRMITPNGRFSPNSLGIQCGLYRGNSILTGLLSFMLDNHQTAGSVRSSDDEKRKLAKASLSYNCENKNCSNFKKLFPEYVEKYYQQQNHKQLVVQQPENNLHPRSASVEQTLLQDDSRDKLILNNDAARGRQSKPVPFWLVLLLLSVFGIMIALPLLQI